MPRETNVPLPKTLQVDFASTVLEAGNYATFVSKRSGAADPILSEMEDASPIFVMMGGVLATAVVCMGLGWRKDRRVGM